MRRLYTDDGSRDDLDALKRRLDDRAEEVAAWVYGRPTRRRRGGGELRWGKRGSVQLKRYRGRWWWTNFETGERGSLLDLIANALGLDFADAVQWAGKWLGDESNISPPTPRRAAPIDVDEDEEHKRSQAVAIWNAGCPVAGTRAEVYLRQHRAIQTEIPSDAVRYVGAADIKRCRSEWYWWGWPALVLAVTDTDGAVTGVQLIALEPDGRAALRRDGSSKLKMSLGRLAGSAVRLPGDNAGPLLLGEGFETAASGWYSTEDLEFETWAMLGAVAKAELGPVPVSRTIIVLADDDAKNAQSNRALNKKIAQWRAEGRPVFKIKPWRLPRGDKSDLNDVLRAEGPAAVRDRILAALRQEPLAVCPPVEEAREVARHASGKVMHELRRWRSSTEAGEVSPPFKVLRIGLGLGKTESAIRHAVDAAAEGEQIAYLVPTHKLAGELEERVRAEVRRQGVRLSVAVWRGRDAANPEHPAEKMCTELETVREARAAYLDPRRVVCHVCPNRDGCAYLAQAERQAEIWIGAHELLLNAPPEPLKDTSLLVIDEGFAHRVGIIGRDDSLVLTADEILGRPRKKTASATADLLADIMPLRGKLAAALSDHPYGGLEQKRLLDAGLTAENAAEAQKLEWHAKCAPRIHSSTTWPDVKKRIAEAAALNSDIGKCAMVWREIELLLIDGKAARSGRVVWDAGAGNSVRGLRLFGFQPLYRDWLRIPAIHLDATANLKLIQTRVAHAALVETIDTAGPHMRVQQFTGKTWGKGALRGTRSLDKIWHWVVAYASKRGGEWLVVVPKEAEAAITQGRNVPPFMRLAHFGALRGLDHHRNVAGVIVIGRPQPPPEAVERLAGILTGHEVAERVEAWYPSEIVHLRARDGTGASVEVDRHPDPIAEALRREICEGEVLHAIGRARGVNRTADNPVEIVLLGNVPVPDLPLDSVQPWQPPTIDDEILARHGVVLEAAEHAAKADGLTLRTVKGRRERSGPFPYKESLYENGTNLDGAVYQLDGPGHHPLRVWWDARRVHDIRGWLETKLGTLADFNAQPKDGATKINSATVKLSELRTPADPAKLVVGLDAPRKNPAKVRKPEALIPEAAASYRGGVLPEELRAWSRERRRAACFSQELVAKRIGLSRSQLANAEAGRFGLSAEAAARLISTVAALPLRQDQLL